MKENVCGMECRRSRPPARAIARQGCRFVFVFVAVGLLAGSAALAHSPIVDADLSDWCIGAFSNTAAGGGRTEDSGAKLICGNCSIATNKACEVSADCPAGGGTCVNTSSKVEVAWWDNRTDGAVNDLGTVAITNDNTNLYIAAELWVDPDPESLPFGEVAIDFQSGGLGKWHDPKRVLKGFGTCSSFTDRGCTSNADCHFCTVETEPSPSTRVKTCGSGCDPDIPGNACDRSQTCQGLASQPPAPNLGVEASPQGLADYLIVFDFSFWLTSAGDSVLLMQPGTTINPTSPWDPVMGCTPDEGELPEETECDFEPAVNPGQSGGSGGPPGSVEVAIPWSAFGCTGCPAACSCPGFGPGDDFRFTMMVARGTTSLDFTPDGALEDVMSEPAAMNTSTTTDACPGFGIGTTRCEIADGSLDTAIPRTPALPHELPAGGRVVGLTASKAGGDQIKLDWFPSCSAADDDYAVYEGTVGSWFTSYDHLAVNCATGATTLTFTPGAGNRYYVVAPTDGSATEGSLGKRSNGAERPASTSPCEPRSIGNCP